MWQHNNEEPYDLSNLPTVPGVNVVSPCWYDIASQYGQVNNKSVEGYTNKAHAKGYKVWALITSSFDHTLFHNVLSDYHARRFVIEQMVEEADKHKLDGFNLDFENIRDEDKNNLTVFVKEITTALKKKNLTVSMDITVPSGEPFWSNCYDRKALGETLDYVMLMAYDEYTPAMGTPGPTAGLNWVENKLKDTLVNIPREKLVLGMPLYMRIWDKDLSTGRTKGKTLSMLEAQKIIAEKGILPTWKTAPLLSEGLLRCSYEEDNHQYTFWLEDSTSIKLKVNLINKYNLAGAASWRKGFETEDVWPVIYEATK